MTNQCTSTIEDLNHSSFVNPEFIAWYDHQDSLEPAETMILFRHHEAWRGKRVLDLGCGTGRTTHYLAPFCDYVGLDYSQPMAARCRQTFPGVKIITGDARELSAYEMGSFDCVLFSANGIDSIDHAGRLQAIGEIYKVLRPGGLFIFASHNRAIQPKKRIFPSITWSRNPCTLGFRLLRWPIRALRYWQIRHLQAEEVTHALVNDDSHDGTLIMYYITPEYQFRQLEEADFEPLEAWSQFGFLLPSVVDQVQEAGIWIYYVARKRGSPAIPQPPMQENEKVCPD